MFSNSSTQNGHIYDVVICGGGLAGLTLARQLKQTLPQHSVLLVDRLKRPLPEVAFKVGESTAEAGTFYLSEILKLGDYFEEKHFQKMGLRYFFGPSNGPFEARPEYGLTNFPSVGSYTIDRGLLENDLRQLNEADGIEMLEGVKVTDVVLASDEQPHQVILHNGRATPQTVKAKWVIDATGRRRFLQKKLGLARKRRLNCSAGWFRIKGRVDVSDFVPRERTTWHSRVPHPRGYATTHLMGHGYWVWLIPLLGDYTSIGIVCLNGIHDFADFNTYPRAMEWLQKHEPHLARYLADYPPLDFRCMKRCSYTAQKVFSSQRWACVGEAATFADPFYAPGTDMTGFGNSITTEMIKLDTEGQLTPKIVRGYNQFFLGLNDALTDSIQVTYPFFGHETVMTAKLLWDATAAWSFVSPRMFNSYYLDLRKSAKIRAVTARFFSLTRRMYQLFIDWGKKSPGRLSFDFVDYLSIPYLSKLRQRNLQPGKEMDELLADQKINMERVEELAQVLFLLAIEDVMPEQLERFPKPVWLNAWRVSLQPDKWESDGLFSPKSAPRDLSEMRNEVRGLFRGKK